MLASLETF